MNSFFRSVALTGFILALLLGIGSRSVRADDVQYRFKWPYRPGVTSPTTTLPGQGGHADAWDFDIGGGGVNGEVVSAAEGNVLLSTSQFDPNTFDPNDGDGFGNHVKVLVPMPDPEPDITITYAHLVSASVATNARVLQGDQIGIEGKTGYTVGDELPGYPPGDPDHYCGTHLHFQFNPARPAYIDGVYVGGSPPPGGPSTSSIVGAYNTPGAAIQQLYRNLGNFVAPPNSWSVVGWTADRTGTQAGCPTSSYCRLYVHYVPNPQTGHWGSEQDFRQHPQGAAGYEYTGITAGRWAVNDPYWITWGFFAYWFQDNKRVSLPIRGEIGSSPTGPTFCPQWLGCVRYQRFHLGYVWEHQTGGVQPPVFCPDVDPYYPNQNYVVNISDIIAVASHYGLLDAGLQPYEPAPNQWYDMNGDGVVNIFIDIQGPAIGVAANFGDQCWVGGMDNP